MDHQTTECIRELGDDWNAGRFKNFYFPHLEYMEESHISTVYTVQFLGQNLISGGRGPVNSNLESGNPKVMNRTFSSVVAQTHIFSSGSF